MTKLDRLIISKLRQIWLWSSVRREALKLVYDKKRKQWKCNRCKKFTDGPKVDHINPVVPIERPKRLEIQGIIFNEVNWTEYIRALLFCKVEDLQILCPHCHRGKTNKENKERK